MRYPLRQFDDLEAVKRAQRYLPSNSGVRFSRNAR